MNKFRLILAGALLALAIAARASAQGPQPPTPDSRPAPLVQGTPWQGVMDAQPRMPTPDEVTRREREMEERLRIRAQYVVPTDPNAPEAVVNAPPSEAAARAEAPSAPGDFAIYRNTLITDTFTNNATSSTNEPTAGAEGRTTLYAGNWYATLSGDYGQTFAYINPSTFFPNPAIGGTFCCDQVVYYERTRGIMLWYLQYTRNITGNNTVRLAVSAGQENLVNGVWVYFDVTPQMFGYANGVWFDFPDLAVSNNDLYITTNIIGAADNAIVFRLDLDNLKAGSVAFENFTSPLANLRATQGAGATMYVGTQVDNNTLRIYSWPEANPAPTSVDRDVNTWYTAASSAPSPDGTNWIARDFHDILASWTAAANVGFMWGSSQGGGFAWPNVRFARFDTGTLNLSNEGTIWNPTFAWAYPSVHPNDAGYLGGTITAGGGPLTTTLPYPASFAWLADNYNASTIAPLENTLIAAGSNGPASNRWGDYYTTRRHVQYGNTWIGMTFVLRAGTGNANAEPWYTWFGREANRPPTNHTIYVQGSSATWESGASTRPYQTVWRGYYATLPGDTLVVRSGNYPEFPLVLDKPITIIAEGGSAVIGQ